MKKSAILFLLLFISGRILAQGTFSGDLMMNLNFFQRDTNIKASGNPLYDNYLSGSEGWLDMRYNVKGYTFFVRADAFNNSNLKDPTAANTDFGLGAWSITKDTKDLSITVGSIYDQVGSGILFRAYEDRGLLIDNALVGIELKYRLTKNIKLKGFTGQQKDNHVVSNNRYAPVIRGFNAEGDFNAGKAHIIPGIGVLNRTLDANSMNKIVSTINSYPLAERFEPMYNMYAFCAYNTLTYKNLSWYAEGDYKTHEAVVTNTFTNQMQDKPGNVEYTAINYGKKGIALNLTGKRTEDFIMRTSPNELLLDGMLNRQPVISDQRPERLMARYTPASQDISEMAGTANLLLSPNDVTAINLTYTHINTLDNQDLYREAYVEANYQGLKSWIFQVGAQYLEYNILLYQIDSKHITAPILYAVTPFTEITYRFSEKKSLRVELQYMDTKQDYGSWAFALVEFDIAPKWSLSASDMYNVVINKNPDNPNYTDFGFASKKAQNYYNLFVAYTKGPNRFSLAYVKQVDGINCTGGVCRYEPAFSGVKATVTSSF
jgi:uncharacterized protein DUF6029